MLYRSIQLWEDKDEIQIHAATRVFATNSTEPFFAEITIIELFPNC